MHLYLCKILSFHYNFFLVRSRLSCAEGQCYVSDVLPSSDVKGRGGYAVHYCWAGQFD